MAKNGNPPGIFVQMEEVAPMQTLLEELRSGLANYWRIAARVLKEGGVTLNAPKDDDFFFEKNFFSFLFLYSFYRARIPEPRRMLYASVLQCLRGMVTGCDNLLDDEYKKTLDTDIPENGFRFRSVVDIMVSDRVLFQLLIEAFHHRCIDINTVLKAATASMKSMMRSGIQEALEQGGIARVLKPDELLQTIHHYKTGILFQCPWDIPLTIEPLEASAIAPLLDGLYRIGMGCQIMDDMVDFMSDLKRRRHNYMVSLIYHGSQSMEKAALREVIDANERQPVQVDLIKDFPVSVLKAFETSHGFLQSGLNLLLAEAHRDLVGPSIQFLRERIGVADLYRRQYDEAR